MYILKFETLSTGRYVGRVVRLPTHNILSHPSTHTFIDCSPRSTVPCFNLIQPILPPRASSGPRLNSNTNFNTGTLCSKGKTLRFRALLTHAHGTQMCCLVNTVSGINSEVVGTLTLTSSISRHISTNPSPSTHNTFWGNFKPFSFIISKRQRSHFFTGSLKIFKNVNNAL